MLLGPFDHAWSLRSPVFYVLALAIILLAALLPTIPRIERIVVLVLGVLAIASGSAFARVTLLASVSLQTKFSVRASYLYCIFFYYGAMVLTTLSMLIAVKMWHRHNVELPVFRLALLIVTLGIAMVIGAGEVIRANFRPGGIVAPGRSELR